MNREQYQRLQALFHEAASLEGEAREEFLDRRCAGDDDLRRNLERLLEQHESEDAGEFDPDRFVAAVRCEEPSAESTVTGIPSIPFHGTPSKMSLIRLKRILLCSWLKLSCR